MIVASMMISLEQSHKNTTAAVTSQLNNNEINNGNQYYTESMLPTTGFVNPHTPAPHTKHATIYPNEKEGSSIPNGKQTNETMALSATVPTMNHQSYYYSSSSSSATQALEKELRRLARQESSDSSLASVDMVNHVSNRLCSFHFDSERSSVSTAAAMTAKMGSTPLFSSPMMIHWDSTSNSSTGQTSSDESSFVSESTMDSWDNFLADFDEVTATANGTSNMMADNSSSNGNSKVIASTPSTRLGKRGRDNDDRTSILSTSTGTTTYNAKRGRMVRCKKIKSDLASLTRVS
jgi:hypothetical protein